MIPDKIKIGGQIYSIERPDICKCENRNTDGLIHYDKSLIELQNNMKGDYLNYVLIHEIMHGVFEFLCLEQEESKVDQLAKAWHMVMEDNMELCRHFAKGAYYMKKIAVCVMSRANYGRLKSVIDAIIEHPQLELQLICGCSCLNLPYEIDAKIDCLMFNDSKGNMAKTMGLLTIEMVTALERLKPDIVLVHGDRYEVLACAVAASYMGILLAHTEGGEVTGCIDDKVRNAITALADIHFPVTENGAHRIAEKMGATGYDVGYPCCLEKYFKQYNINVVGSPALDTLTKIDLSNNRKEPYILVLHHPNTTKAEPIEPLIEALSLIDMHKVWVNPNTDAGSKDILKKIHSIPGIEFVKDLPPEEYYRLLNNCKCAVGNSSSFIKEGAFLGVPAVIVGNRQQNREHAQNVLFVKNNKDHILTGIDYWNNYIKIRPSNMFGDGTSGKKIADILAEV